MSDATPTHATLCFIGGGNMATAIIAGLIQAGWPKQNIRVSDPAEGTRLRLADQYGIQTFEDNSQAAQAADFVVLAVKPQILRKVAEPLANSINASTIVVSIAAGITTQQMSRWLGGHEKCIRVMPNTPALLGVGASGLFATQSITAADKVTAESIFAAVGEVSWVEDESQMNSVTALSGSGPAYVFAFAEALTQAGVALGLPQQAAHELTIQTILGAARMMNEAGETPAVLRERVTSPGGTTAAALASFSEQNLNQMVLTALTAAKDRGSELSETFN